MDSKKMLIHFIDVGYGEAHLLQFPDGSIMMIDAGGSEDAMDVMMYLKEKGVTEIQTAIIDI